VWWYCDFLEIDEANDGGNLDEPLKIIALFEAAKECTWLRRITQRVQNERGINTVNSPAIIFEDNAVCVAQIQMGNVKSNITKHI